MEFQTLWPTQDVVPYTKIENINAAEDCMGTLSVRPVFPVLDSSASIGIHLFVEMYTMFILEPMHVFARNL